MYVCIYIYIYIYIHIYIYIYTYICIYISCEAVRVHLGLTLTLTPNHVFIQDQHTLAQTGGLTVAAVFDGHGGDGAAKGLTPKPGRVNIYTE